jgi:PiT family inorganic phosphate transporter
MEPFIIFGIVLALVLNFVNGLNDASHSVATVVATKALSPVKAILLSAICNMFGPFIFATAVAVTIGTGIIEPGALTPLSIVVAMVSAILLIVVATRTGMPISSSHAMVGALLGAGIGVAGLSAVLLPSGAVFVEIAISGIIGAVAGVIILGAITASLGGDMKQAFLLGAIFGAAITIPCLMIAGVLELTGLVAIVLFIFISPILGMVVAFLLDVLVSHLFRYSRQNRMHRIFQPLHSLASLFQAAAHGANDGQHAAGLITALLVSAGILSSFEVPTEVILASAVAIGFGTCFGGWQVIEKMAKKITKIRPYQGFCAATTGSTILAGVTMYGIPVSSTHVISGAIIGVGATRGKNAVQWDVVREMMTAWVITIPVALVIAYGAYYLAAALLPAFA